MSLAFSDQMRTETIISKLSQTEASDPNPPPPSVNISFLSPLPLLRKGVFGCYTCTDINCNVSIYYIRLLMPPSQRNQVNVLMVIYLTPKAKRSPIQNGRDYALCLQHGVRFGVGKGSFQLDELPVNVNLKGTCVSRPLPYFLRL